MAKVNKNYLNLKENYLFSDIAKRVKSYQESHKDKTIIKMGIGDVTRPLTQNVVKELISASAEMGVRETFKGYGPEQGYQFLREGILNYYKESVNVNLDADEIFVSDGAKSDIANITDIFSNDNTILIPDPVYPVYLDSNIMLNRTIKFLNGNQENGFLPMPYEGLKGDIVYLCSPNNPTGAVYTKEQLQIWVDFAIKNNIVILYDSAYEAYITEKQLPRSIFVIEDAKKCAIEFCSLSKTAGFTGTRCGYTVVPKDLILEGISLNKLWLRRQTTKFNGVSYIIQKGASAVFTKEGSEIFKKEVNYYLENAKIMAKTCEELGIWYCGGINSPYIWLKCPNKMNSWEFFDLLLNEAQVVGTPGAGFGECGEGYFRLSAFNTYENTKLAMEKIKKCLKNI